MAKIKSGYYIKARCMKESEVAKAPPHVRETWDWLLREANHKDIKSAGKIIKRGQVFTSYKEIIDGLSWHVGYRKEGYDKHQISTAMKWLTKRTMVTTARTTRGVVVTICNYNYYQNPQNYENRTENPNEPPMDFHDKQECKELKNKYPCANFNLFWAEYPKKKSKQEAYAVWKKIKPNDDLVAQIMDSLRKVKKTVDWLKENGQFVPQAHNWLGGARWEDEHEVQKKQEVAI